MNSLEFIVSQDILFIFTNFIFVFFCFILSYIISRISNSKIIFIILFIGLSSIAYSDLFIKYTIKNYYELTQKEVKTIDLKGSLRSSLSLTSDEKSSFIVEKNSELSFLPKIYIKHEFKFIDRSKNELVSTAFNISFVIESHKFRNKYLYWGYEKEEQFNPDSIGNFDYIYKKILENDLKGSIK